MFLVINRLILNVIQIINMFQREPKVSSVKFKRKSRVKFSLTDRTAIIF